MLTSSSGTGYILNKHEDLAQYVPNAIPSNNAMSQLSFKSGDSAQNCWVNKLIYVQTMSLMSMTIYVNIAPYAIPPEFELSC